MPMVQFIDTPNKIRITKYMHTPKRVGQMDAWFKDARKAVPEIPETLTGLWYITHESANTDFIRFDLESRTNTKVHVVIARNLGCPLGGANA